MEFKTQVQEIIENNSKTFTDLSDTIWGYAETGFNLTKSADAQCKVLSDEGFQITRGIDGMADAILATYGTGSPVIALLGEYDALPNLSQKANEWEKKAEKTGEPGHGCGHHLLGTGSLAAAIAVKKIMEENGIEGTLRYYGCPAEESGCGKTFMARDGIFDDVDAFLTWHPFTEVKLWGGSALSTYEVFFEFKGRSAHAAAAPENGRSALDAAELMNVGVNYLREHVIPEARMHYAYWDTGGHYPNVVQATSKLLYFIRAPKTAQVKEIYKRVEKIAKGAAMMTETEVEVSWYASMAEYFPNKILSRALHDNMTALGNIEYTDDEKVFACHFADTADESATAKAQNLIKTTFPKEKVEHLLKEPILGEVFPFNVDEPPIAGSTDVGDASWIAPTAMMIAPICAQGTVPHSWQYVACGKSSIAHKGMLYAAKTLAMTTIDLLTNPELLEKAKLEHKETLNGEKYFCPIPLEVKPER
ncbi:MAG: M20 family metallopeptidase [Synergistaceae bacterium]